MTDRASAAMHYARQHQRNETLSINATCFHYTLRGGCGPRARLRKTRGLQRVFYEIVVIRTKAEESQVKNVIRPSDLIFSVQTNKKTERLVRRSSNVSFHSQDALDTNANGTHTRRHKTSDYKEDRKKLGRQEGSDIQRGNTSKKEMPIAFEDAELAFFLCLADNAIIQRRASFLFSFVPVVRRVFLCPIERTT